MLKQIMATNTCNILHKIYQNNLNQIKRIPQLSNLTISRAEKKRAKVMISKDSMKKNRHIHKEYHITHLNWDPTELYQKQIQQAIKKCSTVIEKFEQKYLMNIKPMAPNISGHIKSHKINEPNRPVINKYMHHHTKLKITSTKN
jgi:hypothetical protein